MITGTVDFGKLAEEKPVPLFANIIDGGMQ
jgi:hypothetical protein